MWALLAAYILGGLTLLPILVVVLVASVIYLSPPVGDADAQKFIKRNLANASAETTSNPQGPALPDVSSIKAISGWITARRTFEEPTADNGSYVSNVLRSFLDSKQGAGNNGTNTRRPKDTFYAVLKASVLYLYEDEACTECYAALQVSSYDVAIWPEGLMDGELFAKRNGIRLAPKDTSGKRSPSPRRDAKHDAGDGSANTSEKDGSDGLKAPSTSKEETFDLSRPYFIFVKSNIQMEDWYLALVHASTAAVPIQDPLVPLAPVFSPTDMAHLVRTLDSQPDPIPMRWLNALVGRLFFSLYKTDFLEAFFIGRIMKKIAKVPRPAFLTEIVVREFSIGNTAPFFSKPMLKELTKEGDASVELGFSYKSQSPPVVSKGPGSVVPAASSSTNATPNPNQDHGLDSGGIRIIVEATVTINIKGSLPLNLGSRFDLKDMTVKLVLAVVLRSMEGNLLVRIKRPPSNRIWYGFTSMPKMEMDLLPIVSDRKIKWGLVLKPIENLIKEVIQESVVLPNMDDIAFFDTDDYLTRGGIFADTVRTEYDFTSPPTAAGAPPATPSGKNDTIPVATTVGVPSDQPPTREPPLEHSKATEPAHENTPAFPHTNGPLASDPASIASTESVNTTRSAPAAVGAGAAEPAVRSRRISWLSRFGAQNNESTSTLGSVNGPAASLKEREEGALPALIDEGNEEPVKEDVGTKEPVKADVGDSLPKVEAPPVQEAIRPTTDVVEPKVEDLGQENDLGVEPKGAVDVTPLASSESQQTEERLSTPLDAERAKTLSPAASKALAQTRKRSPTLGHQSAQSVSADFFSPPTATTGALNSSLDSGPSNNLSRSSPSTPRRAPPLPPRGSPPLQNAAAATPSPARPVEETPPPRSTSPVTAAAFISAWKNTRTGADKQALVASAARDAMRKWGFGLKKDDEHDSGKEDSQPRSNSAERGRERERNGLLTPEHKGPRESDLQERLRKISGASSNRSADTSPAHTPKASTGGYWGDDIDRDHEVAGGSSGVRRMASNSGMKAAASHQSPVSKPTADAHTPQNRPVSPMMNDRALSPVRKSLDRRLSATSSHAPIYVHQPSQAAMMRVPAIHSSHKGEVMALGSSPPPPPQTPALSGSALATGTSQSDGAGMGPKLQSVYRLFQKKDTQLVPPNQDSPAGVAATEGLPSGAPRGGSGDASHLPARRSPSPSSPLPASDVSNEIYHHLLTSPQPQSITKPERDETHTTHGGSEAPHSVAPVSLDGMGSSGIGQVSDDPSDRGGETSSRLPNKTVVDQLEKMSVPERKNEHEPSLGKPVGDSYPELPGALRPPPLPFR